MSHHYRRHGHRGPRVEVVSEAPGGGDAPPLTITMLGAGQEVGRSCCVIQHQGKTIVCDAGLHPAFPGQGGLPFIDELDWSTVDAILITHFHVDHASALPYVMEKTNFGDGHGKVYMTHATKAIYTMTMTDTVRINDNQDSGGRLFSEADVRASVELARAVDYHQVTTVSGGLKFTPYHAGHVLGAAMFLIEIAGLKVLYTGDYSREEDRHLVMAEIPPVRPDVLICESTFGVHTMPDRKDKEEQFTTLVSNIVRRGGKVLMPIPSFGNGQELALLLDEYWDNHPELQGVPVYVASGLFERGLKVYKRYASNMNSTIKNRFSQRNNPFDFKYVKAVPKGVDPRKFDFPCVIMASAQFMSFGMSRDLLENWAPDPKNGVIVTGYSIEGTMARTILGEPDTIEPIKGGKKIPRRCTVKEISFGAHVDYAQNSKFIQAIGAPHVVLVHGEASQMGRLRAALRDMYATRGQEINIHTPRNLEPLTLSFKAERVVKAIGSLAEERPSHGARVKGLLVSKDFSYTLLDPKDLEDFTGLTTSSIVQKQSLPIGVDFSIVRWHLEGMYGELEDSQDEEGRDVLTIMNAVRVVRMSEVEIQMQWISNTSNDMIADSALVVLLGIDSSPATVKMTSNPHPHAHHHHKPEPSSDFDTIQMFLEAHFGDVVRPSPGDEDELTMKVTVDGKVAIVDLISMKVESEDHDMEARVESVLEMALTTITPLSRLYVGQELEEKDLALTNIVEE